MNNILEDLDKSFISYREVNGSYPTVLVVSKEMDKLINDCIETLYFKNINELLELRYPYLETYKVDNLEIKLEH